MWLRSAAVRSGALRRTNDSRLRTMWPARPASRRTISRSRRIIAAVVVVVEQQLDAADNRLQRVVDLVRDAGHELAHRRQPLAVHQLIAKPQLLGDVALDRDEVGDLAAPRSATPRRCWTQVNDEPSRRRRRSVPRQTPRSRSSGGISSTSAANAVIERLRKPEQRELAAVESDRSQERVVGMLDRAVGTGNRGSDRRSVRWRPPSRRARESARCSWPRWTTRRSVSRPRPPTVAIPVSSERNEVASGSGGFAAAARRSRSPGSAAPASPRAARTSARACDPATSVSAKSGDAGAAWPPRRRRGTARSTQSRRRCRSSIRCRRQSPRLVDDTEDRARRDADRQPPIRGPPGRLRGRTPPRTSRP